MERLSKSLPRSEDVPHYRSFAKSFRASRGVILVLSGDFTSRKFSIGEGRRKGTKTYILHKQSAKRSIVSSNHKKDTWRFACTLSKFENHVHGLLVTRLGVEIQGYKEAMCSRGAWKL